MNRELQHALQRLWTKAVGNHDYYKEEWMDLEAKILVLERDLREAKAKIARLEKSDG